MSSCSQILKDINATKAEIEFIDRRIEGGLETGTITDEVLREIDNQRFRETSNKLSEANTIQFLDKLKQVATKVKKPYTSLFRFLVGDKSGITSRSLARAQARHGFFAYLKI
jgi:hypothetical protein